MSAGTAQTGRMWSKSELQSLPDDGCLHEVVGGELVMSPKNNFQHEQICGRLSFALESYNRAHHLLPGWRFAVADLFKDWDWE